MSDSTLTLVFGEDRADQLGPLTVNRVKSALPFGGEYRVIDFVLTGCLHSGLRRILVLAAGQSHSLYAHLRDGWSVFNPALGEYITPLPTPSGSQRQTSESLSALKAAVPQIEASGAGEVVVLVGCYVYRMDYAAMLSAHRASGAELTMATIDGRLAIGSSRPGVTLDSNRAVALQSVPRGAAAGDAAADLPRLLGAYVLSTEVLLTVLNDIDGDVGQLDFGTALLAPIMRRGRAFDYRFGGKTGRVSQDRFWTELGTIDNYFDANIALLEPIPPIDLYQTDWPVWSQSTPNPPARTVESASGNEGLFVNSVVASGTVISGGAVSRSVLGHRVRVEDNAVVERAILFDDVHVGVGANIRNCIVDKRAIIGAGERIGYDPASDAARFTVTPAGVVVVPAGYRVE